MGFRRGLVGERSRSRRSILLGSTVDVSVLCGGKSWVGLSSMMMDMVMFDECMFSLPLFVMPCMLYDDGSGFVFLA